jgi:hypothetical protein
MSKPVLLQFVFVCTSLAVSFRIRFFRVIATITSHGCCLLTLDCLLNGLDDIGLTMEKMDTIRAFEAERSARFPWLDGATTRVPALWAVQESEMPADTPSHQLSTSLTCQPSPPTLRCLSCCTLLLAQTCVAS